jgi:hypothetical protein
VRSFTSNHQTESYLEKGVSRGGALFHRRMLGVW